LAGLTGNSFLTKNILQQFFAMKTFTAPSTSENIIFIFFMTFKLGKIGSGHNHLLSNFSEFLL